MVVYSWTTASDLHALDSSRRASWWNSCWSNVVVVPLKDISRVASVIEHLCDSHIDRPAILKRYGTLDNLD